MHDVPTAALTLCQPDANFACCSGHHYANCKRTAQKSVLIEKMTPHPEQSYKLQAVFVINNTISLLSFSCKNVTHAQMHIHRTPRAQMLFIFLTGFRLLDIYNVNVMDRTVVVEVLHQLRWEDGRCHISIEGLTVLNSWLAA
jgi:hypothetical protein